MTHDKGQGGTLTPCLPTTPHIDWERRRYETASRALAAFLTVNNDSPWSDSDFARAAVGMADALIAELKKEGGEQ